MAKTFKQYMHPNKYIDGQYRNENPCGYCHCLRHKGRLNVKLVKQHKCVQKTCPYFEKYKEHGYWRDLERQRQKNIKERFERKNSNRHHYSIGLCMSRREADEFLRNLNTYMIPKSLGPNCKYFDFFAASDIESGLCDEIKHKFIRPDSSIIKNLNGNSLEYDLPFVIEAYRRNPETAKYSSDELITEFRNDIGRFLPEDFDYPAHIGIITSKLYQSEKIDPNNIKY